VTEAVLNGAERVAEITRRLTAAFEPTHLEVIDESHKHVGHAGARDGRGHFAVVIHSAAFEGKKPIERHRMVYEALGALMTTDIHALSIDAKPPA
jgi:BolA protein